MEKPKMTKVISILLSLILLMSVISTTTTQVMAIGNYGVNLDSHFYSSSNPFRNYWGQCTWYAWGRAYEKTGVQLGYRGNAKTWTSGAVSTPRANSVAVWTGGTYGHVAFVEKYDGTNIYISEANRVSNQYSEGVINLSTRRFTYTYGGTGSYNVDLPYGYIYCGNDPTPDVPTGSEMTSGYARTIPDGDYVIASALGRYYLDISGTASPATDGDKIQLWECTGLWTDKPACDVWTLKYDSATGFYTIYQKGTNVSLDVTNGSKASGAKMQAYHADGTPAQRFAISRYENGKYKIQAKCSGFCLDVYNATAQSGTIVQQYVPNGTAAQQWYFIPYKPSVSSSDKVASTVYGGHEYTLYKKLMTWNDARDWCKNQGGNLVTITSSGEQAAVESLMTKASNWIWLGATDEASEGTWRWVTGESFSYSKWAGGQPDNTGNEDYLQLYLDGKWNDIPDYDGRTEYFILEKTHTHTSNSGTITTQPTCTQTGVKTYKCTTCGATVKTETVSALGHTEPDSNGNCTRCGAHIKDVVNPDACPYCGQVHDGFFGRIVAFFHKVIYLIDQLF